MDKEFYINLGKNIKKRRKELGLSQQGLADKLELSLNFVGKIEVAFSKPSLDTVIKIADVLETSVSDLCKFE
ncbi:TPA: transcriptional regulator [Candidatus Gastranaerophilales bacterium HUM_9]|nr:MAG TPA: transcriptional regulator [Candidatus Gastranaerophilales bacterium HUM_9]HBX34547.1 XRE family transcriptional regulator [Cyanobacteria bacterium UBA11440]